MVDPAELEAAMQAMQGQEMLPAIAGDTLVPPDPPPPPPETMDEDEFKETCRRLIERARDHMEDDVLPAVRRAWRYYHGEVDAEPMGFIGTNPETGEDIFEGSNVVVTECRDKMQALIPDLYRIFQSVDQVVVFMPQGADDVDAAEQATEYCNYVFWSQPDAERFLKDALLDWGVKYCAVRVWWEYDEQPKETPFELENLDELQIHMISQDPDLVSLDGQPTTHEFFVPQLQPDGSIQQLLQQVVLYNVKGVRHEKQGKCCIALIPQEELIYDGESQHLGDCAIIGTDCERRVTDVVRMGVDFETVKEHATKVPARRERSADTRRARENSPRLTLEMGSSYTDTAMAWVRVVDAKVLVDRDGDGIAEPYRVLALGDRPEVVHVQPDPGSDEIIIGSPFPIPHKIVGQGIVESLMDIQDQATFYHRRINDNLGRSINPRLIINSTDNKVIDQALEWFGGPIVLGPGDTFNFLEVPFVGAQAFQMLDYLQQLSTLRTGISPAAMGLDPNALKAQTVDASKAIVAAPQSRVDGFAREFAWVMRNIFRALLRLSVAYQDKPTMMRLSNKWVSVDPRPWNADMDARPEVGLGTGSKVERMTQLSWVAQKQEMLMAQNSPLVDLPKYHQTLSDMTNVIGIKDPDRYWNEVSPEQLQQIQQQAEQQRQKQLQEQVQAAAAIETAKVQPHAQARAMEAQLKAQAAGEKTAIDAHAFAAKAQLDHEHKQSQEMAKLVASMQKQADTHEAKIKEINAGFATKMAELQAEIRLEMAQMMTGDPAGNGNINSEDHAIAKAAVVKAHRQRTEAAIEKLTEQMQILSQSHQAQLAAMTRPKTIVRNEAGDIVGIH